MTFMFDYSHFMHNGVLWVPPWYQKTSYLKSMHSRLSIALSNIVQSSLDPNLQ
eukprot:UN21735